MNRPSIITISGKPGSGKSSTADRVAELLSFSHYSAGDFVRSLLERENVSLREFNELAAQNHLLDDEIDQELRGLRDHKDIVIDARLGFYWIPESFKVYLELDSKIATKRIYDDASHNKNRLHEIETSGSVDDLYSQVEARISAEQKRFTAMYNVDPFDTEPFDLVVNTANSNPQLVAKAICATYLKWRTADTWEQEYILAPKKVPSTF